MRVDNLAFKDVNQSTTKSPRYVIKVEWDTPYYFTSHQDTAVPDGVAVTHNVITSLAVTSQSLDPLNARTTIGNISFSIQNKDDFLSLLLKTKDEAGEGVREKTVEVYVGDEDLDWSDYQLIQTQVMAPYSNTNKIYTFKCEDIQRSTIKNIFDVPVTNISTSAVLAPFVTALDANLSAGATIATVNDTSKFPTAGKFILNQEIIEYTNTTPTSFTGLIRGVLFTTDTSHSGNDVITQITDSISCINSAMFELIEHGTSYTDAPNATVGYIIIDNEIIRYYSTDIGEFKDCIRGVLNTKAVVHDFDISAGDRNPKIEAYLYYEMPILKLALAVLTGDLYNQPGKTLESYSHLDISTLFVATSKFIVHNDLFDPLDDTLGFNVRFEGITKQDGQQFLQKEIYQLAGGFSPILSDGQLSFERTTGVLSDSAYVDVLDNTNVVSYGALTNDTSKIHNQITIKWNWNERAKGTTRTNSLTDGVSIAKHKAAPAITKTFRGLYGGIHSSNVINQQFDSLRDRYAGAPLLITITCFHRMNNIEVGDIVRVVLDGVSDHTNENITTTDLDRSFEVQKVTIDWVTGNCTFQLFGSSDKASPIALSAGNNFLDDSYYVTGGTDISTVLPSTFTGGVLHIDGNGTLNGHATDNKLAVYFYDGPVEFDFGTTTEVNGGNVFFRFNGFLQVNGKINLKGIGRAGAISTVSVFGDFNSGTPGYVGNTTSAGGVITPTYTSVGPENYRAFTGDTVIGVNSKAPKLILNNQGVSLSGIPQDMRGTSGSSGGTSGRAGNYEEGGAGGASGGSAVFVSKGIDFGVNGDVDISGADGSLGSLGSVTLKGIVLRGQSAEYQFKQYPGTGGGGSPGAAYFLIDGSTSTVGSINVTANQGRTTVQGLQMSSQIISMLSDEGGFNNTYSYFTANAGEAVAHSNSSFEVQYIPANLAPEVDVPRETSKPIKITLQEVTNTPESISNDFSSIEVTVTPPTDANYESTNLYAKLSTNSEYKLLGSANREAVQLATMDGSTYEFKAHGVSSAGIETDDFVEKSITVSNTTGGVNFGDGNYIAAGKTSFADTTAGFYLEKTAIGGRAHFGGAQYSVTIDDIGNVTLTGTITAEAGFIGGFTIASGTLSVGTNLILDSFNKSISINSATYATAGLQFQYNSGTPRMYVGDGSTNYFQYDGTNVIIGGGTTKETVHEVYTTGLIRSNADPSTNGGFQLDANGLRLWDGSGNLNVDIDTTAAKIILGGMSNLVLDSLIGSISIKSAIFGNEGVQLEYNSGTPRMYIGNGATKSLEFDGSDVLLGSDTKILGGDSYNNDSMYLSGYVANFNPVLVGNGSYSLEGMDAVLSIASSSENQNFILRTVGRSIDTPTWANSRRLKFMFTAPNASATATAVAGMGNAIFNAGSNSIYVEFSPTNQVYFRSRTASAATRVLATTYTANVTYKIEIVFDAGVNTKLYVDDVLQATISIDLPTGILHADRFMGAHIQSSSGSAFVKFGEFKFNQDP